MSLANPLIIGGILIAAGIILAVVAYLVLSGKPPEEPAEEASEYAPVEASEELPPTVAPPPIPAAEEAAPPAAPSTPIPSETPGLEPLPESATPRPEVPAPVSPGPKPRIRVATLLRDEVTGELIVEANGVEYKSPEELRASSHWTRVEYAAADLQKWLEKKEPPVSRDDRPVEAELAEPKPESMVEQINAILQEQIAASNRSDLAVRLIERPDGAVRVLIGVNSYEINEVPDAEVRELIRRSVSKWESKQT